MGYEQAKSEEFFLSPVFRVEGQLRFKNSEDEHRLAVVKTCERFHPRDTKREHSVNISGWEENVKMFEFVSAEERL